MFKSVITVIAYSLHREFSWSYEEEMLIPKVIGSSREGYSQTRRTDRRLAVGHRRRGDVGLHA